MGSHCCKCADTKNQQQRLDSSISNVQNNQLVPTERYNVNSAKKIIQLALQNSKRKSNSNKLGLATNKDGKYKIMTSTHDEALDQNISIDASSDKLKRNDLPFFAERLTDVRVKVGSRMRLSTDIRSSTMLKVTWFREDKRIQMGGRFFMIDKGNFQSIDIVPVIAHDEGQWTCLAENSYGNSTCSFFLSVIIPKIYQLPNFINNVQVLITEAGTVSLECQVFGVPTPLLQWFKDGEEIAAGDIFALTTKMNDTTLLGYYSCKAVNCMGIASSLSKAHIITSNSMAISLGVRNFRTSLTRAPMLSNILKKKNCIIGDCIALTCEINFLPESKLYWFNRQGRVSSSEKYQIMEEVGSFSVKITEIDANDEGLWKCVAERGENMTHIMSYYLTILIPKSYSYPKFKEPLKVIISKNGIVSFECKVVGIPTPTLKWYRNDQELKRDDVYCITTTSSLGSYCCVARNCMGEVKSTAELTIETIKNYLRRADLSFSKNANIPYFRKGLENVKAEINSKFRFTVQVDISFRNTLHWYRNDNLIVSSVDYRSVEGKYGEHHLEIEKLKIIDDANWRCVVGNDYGHNETSCYLKLTIPKHYKKPEFLENLKVICTEAGQINLECKIKGVPSPTLQWFNGNVELQQGVIHKITPTNDNDCSLGTYTCQASNCMGTVKNSILLIGISNIFIKDSESHRGCDEYQHSITSADAGTREKISKTREIPGEPNTQKKEGEDKICIKLSCDNQHIIHDLAQTTDGHVEAIVTDGMTKLISGENVTTVPFVKLMLKTFSEESLSYNENSEEKDKDDENKLNGGSEKKSQNRECSRDNGAKNNDECRDEEQGKIMIQRIGVQIYRSEEELFQKNSNQSITPHNQEHTDSIASQYNYKNLKDEAVGSICDFQKTEQAPENGERLSNDNLHSNSHTITTQSEREEDTYIKNKALEVWKDAEIKNEHHVQATDTHENKQKERIEHSTERSEKFSVPYENQNLANGAQDNLCDYRIMDKVEKSREKLYNEYLHPNPYAKNTELEKGGETRIFKIDTDYTKAGNDVLYSIDDIELNIDTVEMQGPFLEEKKLNDQSGVILFFDHDKENELERHTEIGPGFSFLDIREENSQKVMDLLGAGKICTANDTKDEKVNEKGEKYHEFEKSDNKWHVSVLEEKASNVEKDMENKNQHHVRAKDPHENKQEESLEHSTEKIGKNTVPCEKRIVANEAQDNVCDFQQIDKVEENRGKLYNEYSHRNSYTGNTELEKEEDNQIFNRDTDYMNADDDVLCIINDIEPKTKTVGIQGPLIEEELLDDRSRTILSIDHKSENELERHSEICPGFLLTDISNKNSQEGIDLSETEKIGITNHTNVKGNEEKLYNEYLHPNSYGKTTEMKREGETQIVNSETDHTNANNNVLCITDDIEPTADTVEMQGPLVKKKILNDQSRIILSIDHDIDNQTKKQTEIGPGFRLSDIGNGNVQKGLDLFDPEKICIANVTGEEKENKLAEKNHGIEVIGNKRYLSTQKDEASEVRKDVENKNHHVRAQDTHENKQEESHEHSTVKIGKNTVPCENRNFANKAQDNVCDFQQIDKVEENRGKLYSEYSHRNSYTENTELEKEEDHQIFNRDTDYKNADDDDLCIIDDKTVGIQGPLIEEELLDDRSRTILSIDHKSENELERHSEICPGFLLTDISNKNSHEGMDLSEAEKIGITNHTNFEGNEEKLYNEYLHLNSYTKTTEIEREGDTQIFNRETDHTNADNDVLCMTDDIKPNVDTVDMQGPIVKVKILNDQSRIILSINHDIENQTEKQTEIGPGFLLSDSGIGNEQKSLDLFDPEKICIANDTEQEKENELAKKNHEFKDNRNERHLSIHKDKASDVEKDMENKNQHHVRVKDPHENEQEESLEHSTEKIGKNTVPCEKRIFANEAQDNVCDFQQIDEVEENGEKLYNEYLHFNSYTKTTDLEREEETQVFNRGMDYTEAGNDVLYSIYDIELNIDTVEMQGPLSEEKILNDQSGVILFIDHDSENELERHTEIGPGFSLLDIRGEISQKVMDLFGTEKICIVNDTKDEKVNKKGEKCHEFEKSDNKWHVSVLEEKASDVGKDVEIENQHHVQAIDTHKNQQDKRLQHSTKKIENITVPCENENFANKAQDNLCDLHKIDEVEENGEKLYNKYFHLNPYTKTTELERKEDIGIANRDTNHTNADDVVLCLINDIELSMDTVDEQASVREEKSLDDQTKFNSTIYSDSKNKVETEPRIESVFLLANIEKRNEQKEMNLIESMKICIENDTQENKINQLCTKYPGLEEIKSKWSLPTLESNIFDSWEDVENENQQNVPVIETHKCARSWKKQSSFLCMMSMRNLASIPKQKITILTVFEKRLAIQVNRFELVNQAVSSNYKRINRTNTDIKSRKEFRIIREITPSKSQYPYRQFSVRPVNRYDQLNNIYRFLNFGIYTQRYQSFTKLLDLSHHFDQIELESSPSKLCLKKTSQYLQLPYFLGQLPSSSKRYPRSFNYLSTSNCFPINRLNCKGRKPKFFISLQNKMTIETSWVKLTCTVFADPNPEVFWFKDGNRLSLYSSNHVVNIVNGVVTLEIYSVRPQDSGEYSCLARNMYGLASTEATLKVTSLYSRVAAVQTHINIVKKSHEYGFLIRQTRTYMDGLMNTYGYKDFPPFEMSRNSMKPATFVCRPLIKEIAIAINGFMRISFQMSGIPTPKVIVLRERRNIMYDRRLHHEIYNDYVMICLKRAQPSDEGSYCIIVQNCFGCDRHFFTMKVTKPSGFVKPDMSPWMKKSYDNRYGF